MLLKELKTLVENIALSEQNLKAVQELANGRSSIKFGSSTFNQWDFIVTEDTRDLYYCSLYTPDGDTEAFVVVDKNCVVSYYDSLHDDIVINGKLTNKAYSSQRDDIETVIDEYKIDGASPNRPPKEGCIFEYLTALRAD